MTTFTEILRDSALAHSTEFANKDVILSDALVQVLSDLKSGSLLATIPTDEELRVGWCETQIRLALERDTRTFKKNILQNHLDLGDEYDLAIHICGPLVLSEATGEPPTTGRIVLLGHLRSTDVMLALQELTSNEKRQRRARRFAEPLYTDLATKLLPHGDYKAMKAAV